MKTYARIENGVVAELFQTDGDITTMFHPSLQWVDTGSAIPKQGWSFASGSFLQPAPVAVNPNDAINAQIAALESNPPVPRFVRESLLRAAENVAALQATPTNTVSQILAGDFGYQKAKALDAKIAALRGSLK